MEKVVDGGIEASLVQKCGFGVGGFSMGHDGFVVVGGVMVVVVWWRGGDKCTSTNREIIHIPIYIYNEIFCYI